MTLLEGPAFAPDGSPYVVDVTAPAGAGKVLRIDLDDESVDSVWTDDSSALTSAQFGPDDGRLYVTDFLGGAIRSMTPDGKDVREVVSGPIDGVPMQPDDVAFGADGALYVTDAAGAQDPYWEASGRIIRVDPDTAHATVLASALPSPNGIASSPDHGELWVSPNTANRVDRLTLATLGDPTREGSVVGQTPPGDGVGAVAGIDDGRCGSVRRADRVASRACGLPWGGC
jgi:lactonase